ncbi:MAG: T9SS type A sorting domain-containing protein [Candidatus Eiseniibacteriota bacterium]
MSWQDDSPPGGRLRYKVRRESVDTRYLWESDEATWPSRAAKPELRLMVPHPISAGRVDLALELEGAVSGPLAVEIYDLQGRLVAREQHNAGGPGTDTVRFTLGAGAQPFAPGVYFARVMDAGGNTSAPAKFVVLK